MYLVPLKTMLVEAVKRTFDAEYPEPDFRNIHCSLEYPVDRQNYPGIWLDYDDTAPLQNAGIAHTETTSTDTQVNTYRRWRFTGYASYTVVALTSLERDRLYDELVRVLAFGSESDHTRQFRDYVESNEFIAANFDFDQVEPRGNAAAPGTPWGTDEIIYERTLNMEVIGEFVSDPETGLIVPLSRVVVKSADPYFEPGSPNPDPDTSTGWI